MNQTALPSARSFPEGVYATERPRLGEDDRSARTDSMAEATPINSDLVFAAVSKEIAAPPEDVCDEPVASGSLLLTAGSKPRRIDPFVGAARGPKVMFIATSTGQGGIERHSV